MKLKKVQLVEAVAVEVGCTKALARLAIDAVAKVTLEAIARGEGVFLLGLGKVTVARRGPKRARNLHTGETVIVPPRKVVLFRPSDALQAAANAKR